MKILITITLLMTSSLFAQQTPEPPYVKPIPPNTEWNIKIRALKTEMQSAEARSPKSILGRRSEKLRQEITSWGKFETEKWIVENVVLTTTPGNNNVYPTPYPESAEIIEQKLSQFPELEWIAPEHYKNVREHSGRQCHYYEWNLVVEPEIDNEILKAVQEGKMQMPAKITYSHKAWISIDTGFPVAFENKDFYYEYSITPQNAAINLHLPDRFLKAVRKVNPSFNP